MSVSVDSMASWRRAVNRKNNRDAILDAGRDVFAEIGYGGTTVRDIIRRTNLASGTFYNYFDSKEAVFNSLSEEIGTELCQLLRDVRQRATSFDGFIEAMFLTYFSYYANNRENYMFTRSNRGRNGMNEVMQGPQVRAGLAKLSDGIRKAMPGALFRSWMSNFIPPRGPCCVFNSGRDDGARAARSGGGGAICGAAFHDR
ncbi:MAG: TetR/AcrR family transcriptional regulator, partial [Pseudomonadota bacterium]|nr:TetR/AcrR family transcriptional regulator [Pseudomonadota bacterium]